MGSRNPVSWRKSIEELKMIPARQLADYLAVQGLDIERVEVQIAALTLSAVLEVPKPTPPRDLFRYRVPKLSEDGACSLIEELADEPYDLNPLFEDREAAQAQLVNLNALIDSTNQRLGADWLGIYRAVGVMDDARLIKLAYTGRESRAEFPLTEAFAEKSNNSRVGLTGWGVVIDDIAKWQEMGGSYYECDDKVKSEVCLPICTPSGAVLGIIDAEAAEVGFFTPEKQAWLVALALVLAEPMLNLPLVEGL